MSESDNRSEERVTDPNRSSESYVRTDERTDEEPTDRAHIPDRGLRTREENSDSDSEIAHIPHPSEILAHHRKPEMQRLRAILLSSGAKIPKEAKPDAEAEA
jgi:hypothetical protein